MAKAKQMARAFHYLPTDHLVRVVDGADVRYAEAHPERFTAIGDLASWVAQRQEAGLPIPPELPPGLLWDENRVTIHWDDIARQAEG
jgi:hypothetical protein